MRALEDSCPWLRDDFRAGLTELREDAAAEARAFAARARVLARLAAQVPRCAGDERGATPWTSFRREVAVARSCSDRAAATDVRHAQRLTSVLTRTLALLETGAVTVQRARAFVTEVEPYDDDVVRTLDAELSHRLALLPPWRIVQEVRRRVLALDAEAAAARAAVKTATRGVTFAPDADDQAVVVLTGPAVPLQRWYDGLDRAARAQKAAGDERPLDALRFDLATAAGDRDPRRRPVQAMVVVPVETALGLSNEPAWLDGYGWLSAPATRTLLVDAELRQVCAQARTGAVLEVAARAVRPPPDADGVRQALVEMVLDDGALTDLPVEEQARYEPSDPLSRFVRLRDRACDGPTGAQVSARRCDLDHERPWPDGPTAAWNLVARSRRTHGLKHLGWTPLRTAASTFWCSPAGQVVEVPRHTTAPPGIDRHACLPPPSLPDARALAEVDRSALTAADELPPWLPVSERAEQVDWTWLHETTAVP